MEASGKGGGERLFASTPYRYLGKLGEGGMGKVYLVEHRETGAPCVAKVIHSHLVPDKKAMDRFRLEAQSLGRLEHPHIVEVLGAGSASDGRPYIILEYLQGSTVSERLRQGPLPESDALPIARQFLSALEAAHQFGIVHSDFKPANIFLARKADGTEVVKVLDFGLAKVLPNAPTEAPAPLADPTTLGIVVGTPRYMSPEAVSGAPLDQRADIYAAGVVLYRMLAGRGPYDHRAQIDEMAAHATEKPAPLSSWIPVHRRLDAVILRALSKDPRERFSSAKEFSIALDGAARMSDPDGNVGQTPPTLAQEERKKKASEAAIDSRKTSSTTTLLLWTLAAFLGAILVGAGGVWLVQVLSGGN